MRWVLHIGLKGSGWVLSILTTTVAYAGRMGPEIRRGSSEWVTDPGQWIALLLLCVVPMIGLLLVVRKANQERKRDTVLVPFWYGWLERRRKRKERAKRQHPPDRGPNP